MALYIPASRRRRRLLVFAAGALVLGLLAGLLIGRASVDTVGDQVSSVRASAKDTSAGLRVLTLHEQAGITSGGDREVELVLARTRSELQQEFRRAPWIGPASRKELLAGVDALAALPDRSGAEFGAATAALARKIDVTFGIA